MTKVEMLILIALLANLAVMVINLTRDLMIWVKKNRRERSINRKNEQLEKIEELTNQMCFERKTNKELIEKCQELLESKNELVKKALQTANSNCARSAAEKSHFCMMHVSTVTTLSRKKTITVVIARASGLCVTTGKR